LAIFNNPAFACRCAVFFPLTKPFPEGMDAVALLHSPSSISASAALVQIPMLFRQKYDGLPM
jgi:hypothetical protein